MAGQEARSWEDVAFARRFFLRTPVTSDTSSNGALLLVGGRFTGHLMLKGGALASSVLHYQSSRWAVRQAAKYST